MIVEDKKNTRVSCSHPDSRLLEKQDFVVSPPIFEDEWKYEEGEMGYDIFSYYRVEIAGEILIDESIEDGDLYYCPRFDTNVRPRYSMLCKYRCRFRLEHI